MSSKLMEPDKFYKFIGEVVTNSNYTVKGSFDGGVNISGFVSSCKTKLTYAFNIRVYRNRTWEFLEDRTSLQLYKEASIKSLPFALTDPMHEYGFCCCPLNKSRQTKKEQKHKSRIKKDIKKLIKDIKKSD